MRKNELVAFVVGLAVVILIVVSLVFAVGRAEKADNRSRACCVDRNDQPLLTNYSLIRLPYRGRTLHCYQAFQGGLSCDFDRFYAEH